MIDSPASISARVAKCLEAMVDEQIISRGLDDAAVNFALKRVDRALFVPSGDRRFAYDDGPLPVGHGQTISQPYVVALMTSLLMVAPGKTVLDVGVGSGYQASILAAMGADVFGIERLPELATAAKANCSTAGVVARLIVADGSMGWPFPGGRRSCFDGIVVGAAAPRVPQPLFDQLAADGRMVVPIGDRSSQELVVVTRSASNEMTIEAAGGVRFVPLLGRMGFSAD